MPISVPTADEVQAEFKQAVLAASKGTETSIDELKGRLPSTDACWRDVGYGVEFREDNHASQFRVVLEIHIEKHQDSQWQRIRTSIDESATAIRLCVPPGESPSIVFNFASKDVGPVILVTCMAQGVIFKSINT